MIYTVRFAHLEMAPTLKEGDVVRRGQALGVMGSSGQSSAPHVHLDVVEGEQVGRYTLADIEAGRPAAAPLRQVLYFVDAELFGVPLVVTSYYGDPDYFAQYGKVHLGFDVVPADRHTTQKHYTVLWPRSASGLVAAVRWDPAGYGHCLHVIFVA